MKKIMYALFGVATLLGACSNEKDLNEPTLPLDGERIITFSLGAPRTEPVTYAQVHESEEYAVNHLDVFRFDSSGQLAEKFLGVSTTSASDPGFPARKTLAQIQLPSSVSGSQDFIFVANNSGPEKMQNSLANIAPGTTKTAFKQEITKLLNSTDAKIDPTNGGFLMTGEKSVNISAGATHDLTGTGDIVMLTRAVARIDVGIKLNNTAGGESLTISKVEFENAPRSTFLFPYNNHQSPANSTPSANYAEISGTTTPNLSTYHDPTVTAQYDERYKKLFYIYERQLSEFTSKGIPTLYVTGVYQESSSATPVNVRYEIPFNISIERNFLYTFILGVDPTGGKFPVLTSSIKTLKWEDEISVPAQDLTLISFTPSNSGFTYDPTTRTMTLDNGSANTYTDAFAIQSKYQGDNQQLIVETTGPIATNNSWIQATATTGNITIQVDANTTGSQREGIIWFRSQKDTSSNQLYAVKIVQP